MRHGFVKAAAVTPKIKVADTAYNADIICDSIAEAAAGGAKIIVLPELCLTGYSCGDLFWQDRLISGAREGLAKIAAFTAYMDAVIFVGMPLAHNGKLYNVAAVLNYGEILGFVPKTYIPNYNEFYEGRHFTAAPTEPAEIEFDGKVVYMGTRMLFCCKQMPDLVLAAEICEDLWTPEPPGIRHARNGATVLVNLSASNEVTGKDVYRRDLVKGQSARLVCGYVYASAGEGESTQDLVYSGHNLIAENGHLLKESPRFASGIICSELDVSRLVCDRRRMSTYQMREDGYLRAEFSLNEEETKLTRCIDPMPFVPADKSGRDKRCDEILCMQAVGLKKRLAHTGCTAAVVGISGGLDSALALLVTVRAFDMLGLSHENIKAVTMPGFGTTDRTYDNAVGLVKSLGAELIEVNITEAVGVHFRDIGQDATVHDVTYENSQARERTQILMDIANRLGGLVVGTGDLSELALGWATYNGDHMSMYAVNASVPKTLVRHLVRFYADGCADEALKQVLYDVLDTPVSPELLPPEDGKISQKTEDIVGPYELHDFYLYNVLRHGFAPDKVYRLAKAAFAGAYDDAVILKWLKVFYRRFFAQQFKRSCLPDGPKVGSVAVSPRGDLRMPSDACAAIWLSELERL